MAASPADQRRQTMNVNKALQFNDDWNQSYESIVVPPMKAQLPSAIAASTMPAVCISILVVELCERLCFYTFTGTQEFFLEHLGYSLAEAGGMNAAMGTLCMAWALFAGWIADVKLGRYQTIFCFGLVYAVGAALAAAAAWPGKESSRLYMLGIMVLVPLGTAGLKANISNFGADQYDTSDPAQALAQEKFFSWFYMSINCGSAVAYGYLTTLGSSGGLGIPKKFGYFAVFLIAAVFMFLAVIIFRSNKAQYRMQPIRHTSPMGAVVARVVEVARQGSGFASSVCIGTVLLTAGVILSVVQAVAPEAAFAGVCTKLAFAASAAGIGMVTIPCRSPAWLADAPSVRDLLPPRDSDFSDGEIQSFLRLLPLLFTANLAFSALYNSMQFWYQQQACQMDLRVGGTQLAGSFFCIADCLGIVLATPIAVDWLNPMVEKASKGRFGHGAKFGLGMLFAAASVLIAARFEAARRLRPVLPEASNCAPEGVHMSDMSATCMIVPFFLMGLGEIYTQPVLMHLAYTQSPVSMRTLTAATGLVVGAVSNAIFTVQIAALAPFVPNDLNKGNLEYGYFANIVIGVVFYVAYLFALRCFEDQIQDS
eukprot:TRINITY_DN5908_c0_g1_i19.p1 TRINITY_DN5908_c0_g1~~TRINITY_DN5908_c0_g1_i19.p1  ORF type:complete len:595 (-),score=129.34 TRINITY_DN5908_c0_g1_i19:90-1874(-)